MHAERSLILNYAMIRRAGRLIGRLGGAKTSHSPVEGCRWKHEAVKSHDGEYKAMCAIC